MLNLLTALSLLLCLAVAVLWVSTRREIHLYEQYGPTFGWGVCSGGGRVVAMWYVANKGTHTAPTPYGHRRLPLAFWTRLDAPDLRAKLDFNRGGFRLAHGDSGLIYCAVGAPSWFLCLLFGVGPLCRLAAVGGRRGRRAWRARQRLCPSCGYDLRATPRCCPECGAAASVTSTT